MPAIGIDLGTTYSCVAVYQDGRVTVIANEYDCTTMPSIVAITETERLVGETAKRKLTLDPSIKVFDVKRLIGRRFNDPSVRACLQYWPFKVVDDQDNQPKIVVRLNNEEKLFAPEQISAMILAELKKLAEDYLGAPVTEAVITVPAYFNDSQRQATRDAGTIAKLNVLRLLNEPTAAAFAYGFDKRLQNRKILLVYDFGGGTFDVSVVVAENGEFTVKSTMGDTQLGGNDFDNRMTQHCIQEFNAKHNCDMTSDKFAVYRLRTACEVAKRNLSSREEETIDLPALFNEIDFNFEFTRQHFEQMNKDLFERTLVCVENALRDAEITKDDVNDIILVGGSTKIPKVQQILQEFFNGRPLNKSINPDEAVAYGAAVQAAILVGERSEELEDLIFLDVTPLSLGLQLADGQMGTFIARNTVIPAESTRICTTTFDNQTSVDIEVYEGERPMAKDNNLLGKFTLHNIPPAPRCQPNIEVTFKVDENGILSVSAVDKSTGQIQRQIIVSNKGRLSQEQVDRMVHQAEVFREEDQKKCEQVAVRNALEAFAYSALRKCKSDAVIRELGESEVDKIVTRCDETIAWMSQHHEQPTSEYERRLNELKLICAPVATM